MAEREAQLVAEIERLTGGKVTTQPEVLAGRGRAKATLRGGDPVLRSHKVWGTVEDALEALLASVIEEPGIPTIGGRS